MSQERIQPPYDLERFALDVIIFQMELFDCDVTLIQWRQKPENRYRWPNYIPIVCRGVSVVQLKHRLNCRQIPFTFLQKSKDLSQLELMIENRLKDLSAVLDINNISSYLTQTLLAYYSECAICFYYKNEFGLIRELPRMWMKTFERMLQRVQVNEGGLDAIKRFGDLFEFVDVLATKEYITTHCLPYESTDDFDETKFIETFYRMRNDWPPDMEDVFEHPDGTVQFLDIVPLGGASAFEPVTQESLFDLWNDDG